MENNKITLSLTAVIIICVVIVTLVFGIVGLLIYFNMVDTNNVLPSQTTEEVKEIQKVEDVKNNKNDEDIKNNKENTSTQNSASTTTESTNSNKENTTTSQSSIVTKTSSQQNPLSIGEWGIASKYSSGEYVNIPVKVTNVIRGNTAMQTVKDFCNSGSSIYKYTDPKEGMEWAVIDYTVDLSKIEGYSSGKSIKVDSKIKGTGDNNSIKYNGYTYIVSTMNMTSGYSKEDIAIGRFAVCLPIGCTDYVIAMGSSSNTQAFFAGK